MADATDRIKILADNLFEIPCEGERPTSAHERVKVDLRKDQTRKLRTGKCERCGQVYYSRITGMGY